MRGESEMSEEDRLKLKEPVMQPTLKVADSPEIKEQLETASSAGQAEAVATKDKSQSQSPSQPYLTVPNEALQALIRHPDTPEDEWVQACSELERRAQEPTKSTAEPSAKHRRRMIVFSTLLLILGAACGSYSINHHDAGPAAGQNAGHTATIGSNLQTKKPTDYQVGSSRYMQVLWKQKMMVQVGQAIYERSWSEAEAAKNLQVSAEKISSLFRDRAQELSIEDLSEMATAMGLPTTPVTNGAVAYSPELDSTPKENQDAVAFYTRALSLDDKNAATYRRRAEAFDNLKQYDRAVEDLTRCIELEPNRPYLLEARAQAYYHAGKNAEALQELNALAAKYPDYDVYQSRSLVYMSLGKYEQSVQDSTTSISRMKTQRPGPYYNRALCYEKMGKLKEAIADYDKTLESDPTYTIAKNKADKLRKQL